MKKNLAARNILNYCVIIAGLNLMAVLCGCQKAAVPVEAKTAVGLTYELDGAQGTIPLIRLDVNLTQNPAFPEIFEWTGEGLVLAGTVPASTPIGYEGRWERIIGKSIALDPRSKVQIGMDALKAAKIEFPAELMKSSYEHYSRVTLPGKLPARVLGGSFVVEKISGKVPGVNGDKRLHGKIEIRVQDGSGEKVLKGTFKAGCATRG